MAVAMPEPSVVMIVFEAPLKLPESVEKRILAPVLVPPDEPTPKVTDRVSVVPCVPVCPSPDLVRVAAGFCTITQPLCFC